MATQLACARTYARILVFSLCLALFSLYLNALKVVSTQYILLGVSNTFIVVSAYRMKKKPLIPFPTKTILTSCIAILDGLAIIAARLSCLEKGSFQ